VLHAVNIIIGVPQVFIWTLNNEDSYLAWDFEQDVYNAFYFYVSQHVDGIFTDFPQSLVRYLNNKTSNSSSR